MDLALIWAIRFALVALLVTPVVVSSSTIFPFIVGKALYSRVIIEIMLGLWLVLMVRRPEYRPARSWLAVIFGLFVLANLISGFFGASFQRTFWSNWERMQGVWDLTHWFVALVILMSVVKGLHQWRILLSLNLVVGLFITLLGVYQVNGWAWSLFTWLRGQDFDRATISLGNATYVGAYGMVMSLTALALLADSLHRRREPLDPAVDERRRGRHRRRAHPSEPRPANWITGLQILYAVAVAAGIWLIFESGSRGATVGFVGGLGAAGIAYSIWGADTRFRVAARVATGLLGALVVVVLLARSTSALEGLQNAAPLLRRTIGQTGLGGSAHAREVGTRIGVQAFLARPITGWGAENFAVVWNRYMRGTDFLAPKPEFDQAHDKPAEILGTTGLLGGLSYAAFWLWLFWLIVKRVRTERGAQLLTVFTGAAAVGFLIHLLFLFDTSSTVMLLTLLTAFLGAAEPAVAERAGQHMPGDVLVPRGERVAPAPPEAPVRGRRARQRRPASDAAREQAVQAGVVLLVVVALGLSLYFFNWRQWQAARLVLQPGNPEQIVQNLATFSQLGTIGRQQLLEVIAARFGEVPEGQRSKLFDLVNRQAKIALNDEPQNLKLRLAAARFYRRIANALPERHDELLAVARFHSERALELGPSTYAARDDQVRQAFAEHDLEGSRKAVAAFKALNRNMNKYLFRQFDAPLKALEERLQGKSG